MRYGVYSAARLKCERTDGGTDLQTGVWTYGPTDGWTDGRMDGRTRPNIEMLCRI